MTYNTEHVMNSQGKSVHVIGEAVYEASRKAKKDVDEGAKILQEEFKKVNEPTYAIA